MSDLQSSDKNRRLPPNVEAEILRLCQGIQTSRTKYETLDVLRHVAEFAILDAQMSAIASPRPSSAETGESLDPVEFVINANDIGATVVPVIHYRALKRELAEAKRDLASSRFIRARSCCCETDEQGDEIVRWCGLHAELRDELAEAKVLLANQAQAVVAMNSARSSTAAPGTLDMSPEARLKDAEADVLRLHSEKMKFFERTIELEREVERYRKGMENWKATAEEKDRLFVEQRSAISEPSADTKRLDFLEQHKCYPWWNFNRWMMNVGEGAKIAAEGEAMTIRDCIDATMSNLDGSGDQP